jgi:hypothetical protein
MTDPAASTGTKLLTLLQAGNFADIREMFPPNLRPMVTPESLRAAWEAEIGRQGAVTGIGAPVSEPTGTGDTLLKLPVVFAHGAATVLASVSEGWLTGLQIAPAGAAQPTQPWQPPDYADPATLSEQEVTVGSGPLAVPGTLTRPVAPGPHPAVVMLVGSGPLDRDETIGRNKPFKDIAWGLAAAGFATVRFDKVTYAHPDKLDATFTIDDEYLHHALAAVELLQRSPGIDPERVFILGHSLGGTVAPRIAAAEPSVAGLILLAGGAEPIHWAAVSQFRYLASLDPSTAAASQQIIDNVTRQAEAVDNLDPSTPTPAADLPFGTPAAYWLSLRGYDPTAEAAKVGRPMLVLQGARDYQVTVADDLSRWQAALSGRPDVTVHVYDADNHFFFAGHGPSTPAEMEPAQHADPAVVTDIAAWVAAQRPS